METLVAKYLSGSENDSFMHRVYPHCCPQCGYPTRQEVNPDFKLTKKRFDVSFTYDGYLIVSQRFKDFCQEKKYGRIAFHELQQEPGFYCFEVLSICPLDCERRKVQFVNYCPTCGRYAEVIGVTPSYLPLHKSVDLHSLYRSEYEFGSYAGKSPLTIVSLDVAKDMQAEKFKGLYFRDIFK